MTGATVKKPARKTELWTKRVGILSAIFFGAGYYWFAYRPWKKHKRHLELEEQAREYWKIHQEELKTPEQ